MKHIIAAAAWLLLGVGGEAVSSGAKPPLTSAAPGLAVGRKLHTATALPDGRVLLVGGMRNIPVFETIAGAELYDPAAGTLLPAPRLAQARDRHTATLLRDGRVLVAGGQRYDALAGGWSMTESEMWDPKSQAFRTTADLRTRRSDHTAVALDDGRVLVAGGASADGDAPEAEVFDPAQNVWRGAGTLVRARILHSMVALPSGGAAVIGGMSNDFVTTQHGSFTEITQTTDLLDTIERWDAATATWTVAARLTTPRASHAALVVRDGRVLVVGGSTTSAFIGSAELCDLGAKSCRPTGALHTERSGHVLVALPNGEVAAVGGETGVVSAPSEVASIEIWNPGSGAWRVAGSLSRGRHEHTATALPSGAIFVTGGCGCGPGCVNTLTGSEIVTP